jgi:cellulose synthase (UDP-forming)
MVDGLRRQVPGALVHYHRPAPRGHEVRGAAAKAGNLNSAVEVLRFAPERVEVIETRDCDDLVADPQFLRWAVAQLVADPKTAYVQSVKWARVADGDPFGNLQPHFYLGAMHARYAANAVFPCGSGVVWRREALSDIGGFPDWNLVEDLQSGWEALKRGWRGAYIPIVGAMGQTAPEDVAVVYKQRGTWALDTIRLLLFERMRGMTVRQRLHFAELGLFYAQSLTTLVFIAVLAAVLAGGAQPVQTDLHGFLVHFLPFGIALELLLYALHRPFGGVWRAREMWTGLTPVFAKAWWLAIRFGPHRKPSYEVTRKEHVHTWYWRETLPQVALLLVSVGAALVTLYDGEVTAWDAWSAWWALLYGAQLAAFVRKSAHGVVFTRPGVRAADGRTIAAVTP